MNKHWLLVCLLFGAITTSLVLCCTPHATFTCLDIDCFDLMYATEHLSVAHPPGLPLYVLLGWLVHFIPGDHAWNLAFFLSVVPTIITCGIIFWIVSRKATSKLAPFVATLAYAGSVVVFSQAIIPEIYALEACLLVGAYAALEPRRPKIGALCIGGAVAITWAPMLLARSQSLVGSISSTIRESVRARSAPDASATSRARR